MHYIPVIRTLLKPGKMIALRGPQTVCSSAFCIPRKSEHYPLTICKVEIFIRPGFCADLIGRYTVHIAVIRSLRAPSIYFI